MKAFYNLCTPEVQIIDLTGADLFRVLY